MSPPDKIARRYASARARVKMAKTARDGAVAADSAALLAALMLRSVRQRFDALADPKLDLTFADRRALARSLQDVAPTRNVVAAGTATVLEVWYSRWRHQKFGLGAMVSMALVTIALVLLALHHTPAQRVIIAAQEPFEVPWSYPDGRTIPTQIRPGQRYQALRVSTNQVQLRYWESGTGYATFWVPRYALIGAPEASSSSATSSPSMAE